ncbi:bifunctional (p)ppGpp synthetase/guanosine-3',5'-bis(diphosphate) 3'-pyrophosphohydrolase [Thalassospira sp. HF15]|jgi:guanosine-3',5'-bis(diphosphate) 3'-pyrophosphohydrolase|uniref:RelA/SpoT family protein n=1 Tax=Thalassospira sp. HF15 TaxID=2722755 RepID=UPI001431E1CD|nr:bifunctional (p)ppGpp synthetase/guanosine-3',5'-bis(diphosphate) 3'-pyrophosphohydrolase [Thalassospira sp. HF15]NIY74245.1 bifunctional (p)ppGpp synthetase/guanosine-3',5'-bis(diphosphate) 3'-pyrophosphohydrolase [Thalassospira sp. HF15]
MMRQYELVERVKAYDPDACETTLNRAYVYATQKHGSQKRASGDPYFSHPIEVAGILTNYKLDCDTIITALLHDTIEDTDATPEEITKLFGPNIMKLVDGVTKLTQIELKSADSKQAENFRKLLLAMSEDIRVLLVKLADRLHNMRTLHYISKPEKRVRIAAETLEIYAPLAERIGMHDIKEELEDLAFQHINPEARDSILARLEFLREKDDNVVSRIVSELQDVVSRQGLKVDIYGREKRPYSIWQKMQRKNITFGELSDIMAFRVLVAEMPECYEVLGYLHANYKVVPGRFKDYISTPKPNGYRSIHTTVLGPENHRIEIQIRTRQMHEVNENGVAAHWAYKQEEPTGPQTEGVQYRWLRDLLDILEHASEPEEFLEHTKLAMFQDQVFCFSPKGDVIALPARATPVDFAYMIHTHIGDTCVGAKVNGAMVPLRTVLNNGDQVEIVTSKAQTPNPTWERFVVTGKARARIRRFIRQQQEDQYKDLGKAILQKAFRQEGYDYSDKALEGVLKIFKQPSVEALLTLVGAGHHTGREVVHAVFPGTKDKETARKVVPLDKVRARKHDHAIPIKGLIPGMAVHYAGCCHPLPGDRIVGIVTTGKGVTIHTIDCDTLETFTEQPERWLDVGWDNEGEPEHFIGRLGLTVGHEQGALSSITSVIAKNHGNITNLRFTNRTTDFFEMLIDIDVVDVKHLTNIIAALRATPVVNAVERARG